MSGKGYAADWIARPVRLALASLRMSGRSLVFSFGPVWTYKVEKVARNYDG